MKNIPLLLLSIFFLQSCTNESSTENDVDKIKMVETSLTTPTYIDGDSTWTIEERMAHYGIPGVSIAVINNGEIEWTKSYGVTNKESQAPVTNETLFQAASISKPVTAYAALTLVQRGVVDLNKEINFYLRSWDVPDSEFTTEQKVTLKNLLNHSAGITVHGFLGYSPDLPVPTLLQVLDGIPPANSGPMFVDKTPEESFRYSGGGYTIVQQMLIDALGGTFPQIMNELVLSPLEMTRSTYDQPLEGEQLALAASGYLPDGTMTTGERHTYPEMAAAGLWTTAEDLAKFTVNIQKALKGEGSVGLSQEMTTKMLTPFVEDFIGLGIFLQQNKDAVYFNHGGWNEGFCSKLMAHKDNGYGVVVMINSNHPDFIDEVIRSVSLTYDWDNYFPTYKAMAIDDSAITEISGKYMIDGNRFIEIYEEAGKIYTKSSSDARRELIKVSDSTYVRREKTQPISFKPNPENSKFSMQLINPFSGEVERSFDKMDPNKKIPIEYLLEGNFEEGFQAYQKLKEADPKDETINENTLNNLGYGYLMDGDLKSAQAIFKVNMLLYPESSNTYDSYAEACMKLGEKELAIENYKKSLQMDPLNNNALAMLKELLNN